MGVWQSEEGRKPGPLGTGKGPAVRPFLLVPETAETELRLTPNPSALISFSPQRRNRFGQARGLDFPFVI